MIINEPVTQYVKKRVEGICLNASDSVYKHAKSFYENLDPTIEHFVLIGMNRKNFVLFTKLITTGTDGTCLISNKQIFKECILFNASSFICLHNHPSGDPSPSAADQRITRQIIEASRIMEINFQDHVIIGEPENDPCSKGYYSMRESGLM
jgi:DNA repair protein RadC